MEIRNLRVYIVFVPLWSTLQLVQSTGRHGSEMGSPGSNPEQGYFVVFLGKMSFSLSSLYTAAHL